MNQPDNRAQFIALLADHGLTQARAANLICEYTRRPCSTRTIRSWVNDPDKPSARTCPEWAIEALKGALQGNGRQRSAVSPYRFLQEQCTIHRADMSDDMFKHHIELSPHVPWVEITVGVRSPLSDNAYRSGLTRSGTK